VRAQLSRAAALDHNGRSDEAVATARTAIRDAELTMYNPVIAEAELELGRILIGRADVEAASPVLEKACKTALATGRLSRLAVEAGARLIYAEGAQNPNLDRLRRDLLYLLPMSQALAGDNFARPLLLNNTGEVYQFAKKLDDARHYFTLAHDALRGDDVDLELTVIDRNLATLAPDPAARLQLAHGAWAKTREVLGAHHLRTLQAQTRYAVLHTDAAGAYEFFSPVCDEYQHSYAVLVDLMLDCEIVRGFLASQLGRLDDARRAYIAIVARTASSSDPGYIVYHQLAEAEVAMLDHRFEHAVPRYQAVIAVRRNSEFWWEQQQALQAELGLGIVAVAQRRTQEAVEHLEAAVKGYGDIVRIYPAAQFLLRLAKARDLLAANR
jgi:tetratricopeptide (TPR) repeat protein